MRVFSHNSLCSTFSPRQRESLYLKIKKNAKHLYTSPFPSLTHSLIQWAVTDSLMSRHRVPLVMLCICNRSIAIIKWGGGQNINIKRMFIISGTKPACGIIHMNVCTFCIYLHPLFCNQYLYRHSYLHYFIHTLLVVKLSLRRSAGWWVGMSACHYFFKKPGSFTPMLLSEHLFLFCLVY